MSRCFEIADECLVDLTLDAVARMCPLDDSIVGERYLLTVLEVRIGKVENHYLLITFIQEDVTGFHIACEINFMMSSFFLNSHTECS